MRYTALLGWQIGESQDGAAAMITDGDQPWAALSDQRPGAAHSHWVPYVQVDDVEDALGRAESLGAAIVQKATDGPAGRYGVVTDPTGTAIALWQPAAAE